MTTTAPEYTPDLPPVTDPRMKSLAILDKIEAEIDGDPVTTDTAPEGLACIHLMLTALADDVAYIRGHFDGRDGQPLHDYRPAYVAGYTTAVCARIEHRLDRYAANR